MELQFKEKGKAGVMKELTQMHDMDIFHPIDEATLSYHKKKEVLSSLMFLKEKWDAMVKVRMCAKGRKEHGGM